MATCAPPPIAIAYRAPDQPGLARVKDRMTLSAHVSPDAGWAERRAFLGGATRTLTVGMYAFGALHVVDVLTEVGRKPGFGQITLALQPGQSLGGGTEASDIPDADAVEAQRVALGSKFRCAWVPFEIDLESMQLRGGIAPAKDDFWNPSDTSMNAPATGSQPPIDQQSTGRPRTAWLWEIVTLLFGVLVAVQGYGLYGWTFAGPWLALVAVRSAVRVVAFSKQAR